MPPFDLREPVSALTHALGLVASFPTTWFLVRAALKHPPAGQTSTTFRRGKVASLAVFGFGMAACYGASAASHALPGDERTIELLRRLDLLGIFLLIAGTFTPSAWALMRPRPRRVAMSAVWGVSAVCGLAIIIGRPFPTWLATSIYLALGWGMVLCYADIRRDYDRRTLRLLPIGGVLYSLGAIVNLTHMEFAPGLGTHEVFHLFVLAGTATHVVFLFRVVVPAKAPTLHDAIPQPAFARLKMGRRRRARIDA